MTLPNPLAMLVTFVVAAAWMGFNEALARRGWISSHTSRKLIHIGTGPLYVLTWLLYPDASGRFWAVWVPLLLTLRVAAVGLGLISSPAAVQAMSRTGRREELLRGPLFYGLAFVYFTLAHWRTWEGILPLMMLCGGDGLADLVGRRWGRRKLPWSPRKSWAGSLGFLLGGWLTAMLVLAVYALAGVWMPEQVAHYAQQALPAALVAAILESAPWPEIDNLIIPLGVYIFLRLWPF
ncbi:MAG: phosphatidate cytidylyltransferase [Chloroflexi bacterium]|nr:phosphatidate cytidylyltransferase [Chloroflexota bacterium]